MSKDVPSYLDSIEPTDCGEPYRQQFVQKTIPLEEIIYCTSTISQLKLFLNQGFTIAWALFRKVTASPI